MNGDKPTQNANGNQPTINQQPPSTSQTERFSDYADEPQLEFSGLNSKENTKPFLVRYWAVFTIISLGSIITAVFVYLMLTKVPIPLLDFSSAPVKKDPPVKFYSRLSQAEVANQAATTQAVTAVMIENSPNARPQSGLKEAEMVFEAVAEGGITRFMAFYQINKPELMGPVRSVRETYLDMVTPFQASIAHVGGSAPALKTVRSGRYRDIDQMFNGGFYWRSTDRYAPHNVYTSFAKLDALNQQKGYTKSDFKMFKRKAEDRKRPQPIVTNLAINLSGPLFNTTYRYDSATNSYFRNQAGQAHLDREKGQINPKAVVAMSVDVFQVPNELRWQPRVTGSNPVHIFQDGQVIEGTWQKTNAEEQIKFLDKNNQEIAINSGQVWLVAVPKETGSVKW